MCALLHYYIVLRAVIRCRKCPRIPHGEAGIRTGRSVVGEAVWRANSHQTGGRKGTRSCGHQANASGSSKSFTGHTLEQECMPTGQIRSCRALPLFSLALDALFRQESWHPHQDPVLPGTRSTVQTRVKAPPSGPGRLPSSVPLSPTFPCRKWEH